MISDRFGAWRTASRSGGGNCVEVAGVPDIVAVRDSKDRIGPRLEFSTVEWAAFLSDAKRGAFDRH
ncbi:DUF397 domain-containing protein [Spirillospora sp. NPDC047279]|uniref:DUF397 domain-containing protein n=1 Tax=Spirillospora sp. NPDC047279 TaxID=3155478 RepID=UPI0033EF1714